MKLFKMTLMVLLTALWALPASAVNMDVQARSSIDPNNQLTDVIARAGYRVESPTDFVLFEAEHFFLRIELDNATLVTTGGDLELRAYGPEGLYNEFAGALSGGGTNPGGPYGYNIAAQGGGVYHLTIDFLDWSSVDVYVQGLAAATSSPLPILMRIEGANAADRGIWLPVDQITDCDKPVTVTIRHMFNDPRAGIPVEVASDAFTLTSVMAHPAICL